MADPIQTIKEIALNAVEESNPTTILYGEVIGVSPLKIKIDQKLILTKEFLVLTNNVCDHDVYMTVEHQTESAILDATHTHDTTSNFDGSIDVKIENDVKPDSTKVKSTATSTMNGNVDVIVQQTNISAEHTHNYVGKKKFVVHNGLKQGEKVILLRFQGGQKFLVLDRVVE